MALPVPNLDDRRFQDLVDESKRLAEEIEQKYAAAAGELGREASDIRRTLTDRHSLADLFAELSLRLKDGPASPGKAAGK